MTHPDDTASQASTHGGALVRLQTPSGRYAMLALDQRESLREMFPLSADGTPVGDSELRTFKRVALEVLTPYASGVLLDRLYGLDAGRTPGIDPGCGLIFAVDVLIHAADGALAQTRFDDDVTVDMLTAADAAAVKILILWRADSGRAEREDAVAQMLALAQRAGIGSLVEGVVRPPLGAAWSSPAERHEAILAAAAELSVLGADLYKAEVPGYVPGDLSAVVEHSRQLSAIVPTDWVVLSNGVAVEDFPEAVELACHGGAAGFLAGRAIWADAPREADPSRALRQRSIDRLRRLAAIVDPVSS